MYNGWWSIKENIHGNVVFLNISKDLQDLFFLGFQLKLFMKLMMKLTIRCIQQCHLEMAPFLNQGHFEDLEASLSK